MTNPTDFGEPIYTYSRADAIADGYLVDVTETAARAARGLRSRASHAREPATGRAPSLC